MDAIKTGNFLRDLRKERNLTQEELGELLGVTNKTISRWENGQYFPPVESLIQLGEIFNVTVNEILAGARLDSTNYQPKAEENIVATLKNSQKNNRVKKIAIVCCLALLAVIMVFAIYALVLSTSKSPDDISKFPTDGLWVCEQDNFVITIDLRNTEDNLSAIEKMQVVIEFNGTRQTLECYQRGGHGTPLVPTSPADILYFASKDLDSDNPDYVHFSTSRYKFNDNDFYLLGIYVLQNNSANILTQNADLHFVRQS